MNSNSDLGATISLFIFAHQDDEVAALPFIVKELREEREVACVFLSDGAAKGVPSEQRCGESLDALLSLGVSQSSVAFIGRDERIADGAIVQNIDHAYASLARWLDDRRKIPERIYCLAWEGGHADHDASHLIALAIARRYGILEKTRQLFFYNGAGTSGKLFRVMRPISGISPASTLSITLQDCLKYAFFCARYPSQWRTWIGLLPEMFLRYIFTRKRTCFAVALEPLKIRPHAGALLYERMFDTPYDLFSSQSRPFIDRWLS